MKLTQRMTTAGGVVLLLLLLGADPAVGAPSAPASPARLFPATPTRPEPNRLAPSAVKPFATTTGYDVATFGYDVARTGNDTAEMTLATGTVGAVTELFQVGFANTGPVDATPVAASAVVTPSGTRDLLYVGNEHGAFGAIDANTGAVVWEQNVGFRSTACEDFVGGMVGVTGSAVLDRSTNRVYVVGGNGKLYAFDMSTGAPAAGWSTPVLVSNPGKLHDYGALTLDSAHHRIYATFGSICDWAPYKGQVISVDSSTGWALRRFVVVKDSQNGGGVWGWGGVSLDANGNVFVTTGNALPDGATEATPYAEYVLKLSQSFAVLGAHHPKMSGKDVDFGTSPTLIDVPGCAGMLAAENKDGHLFVYRRDTIGTGPTQKLSIVTQGVGAGSTFIGMPAYDATTHTLFIAASADGPLPHGIQARRFGTNCASSPMWNTVAGPIASPVSPPVVANGVVYYADGIGRTVHAFDAGSGTQLWSSPAGTFTGDTFSAPLIFDGKIYVSSRGGTVHAFG